MLLVLLDHVYKDERLTEGITVDAKDLILHELQMLHVFLPLVAFSGHSVNLLLCYGGRRFRANWRLHVAKHFGFRGLSSYNRASRFISCIPRLQGISAFENVRVQSQRR